MNNREGRKAVEEKYGSGCMFKRAQIAEKIEKMGGIKTYKKYVSERKYTRKRQEELEKMITYHHLVHRSEGGEVSVENGANINRLAHDYIHSLPREKEEIINELLRMFKRYRTKHPNLNDKTFGLSHEELEYLRKISMATVRKNIAEHNRRKERRANNKKFAREYQVYVDR